MHWLSIDVGTTSTKCLLINTQAEIVAESSCTTQLLTPHPTYKAVPWRKMTLATL